MPAGGHNISAKASRIALGTESFLFMGEAVAEMVGGHRGRNSGLSLCPVRTATTPDTPGRRNLFVWFRVAGRLSQNPGGPVALGGLSSFS
jgi:hypothetical protein